MYKSLFKLLLLSSCSVFSFAAIADGQEIIQAGWWPYPAGATATALSGDITTGFADGMIPVYGKPTQFFYFDPQGQINNSDQYAVSAGVGGRYLLENRGIVGAYVFGDYNHSQYSNSFWFVSPGVEFLGDSFDVTGNLYIPVGTQKYSTGNSVFGQDLATPVYDGITFAGNTEYDALYNTTETSGFGGDIDVAYRIPMNKYNPKLHLAGYFSNPEDAEKNRAGGAVRLEFPFSEHLSVLIADSYDNVSYNTVRVGASYSFGGRRTSYNYKHDLENRMVDQIQRNIIANTGDIHNSQPISENTSGANGSAVYLDNISFFVSNPGDMTLVKAGGTGTYEDPYVGMSQAQIDDANTKGNTNFFVQSGTYGDPSIGMDPLVLENDFVMGRESYNGNPFVKQAEGAQRPKLFFATDGFSVGDHDLNTTLASLSLLGGGSGSGVTFVQQNNGQVDTVDYMDISNFSFGVVGSTTATKAAETTLNVLNSNLHDLSSSGVDYSVEGVGGAATLNVVNSDFNRILEGGIFVISQGNQTAVIHVDNSRFSGLNASGLLLNNGDQNSSAGAVVTVTNSIFDSGFSGVSLENSSQGEVSFTITHSVISDTRNSGIILTNEGAGSINAVIESTTFKDNGSSALSAVQTSQATGDINILIADGSQFLTHNGALEFMTEPPGSGQIHVTVDNTIGDPVLLNDTVSIAAIDSGAVKVTFMNADGSSFSLNGPSSITPVFCNDAGICTAIPAQGRKSLFLFDDQSEVNSD